MHSQTFFANDSEPVLHSQCSHPLPSLHCTLENRKSSPLIKPLLSRANESLFSVCHQFPAKGVLLDAPIYNDDDEPFGTKTEHDMISVTPNLKLSPLLEKDDPITTVLPVTDLER
jgi:hypothetical protein